MNSKKILASLLAVSLCISCAALPVSADNASAGTPGSSIPTGNPILTETPSVAEETPSVAEETPSDITVPEETNEDPVTFEGHNSNYFVYTPTLYSYSRNGGVYLSWDWVSHATKYRVFYRQKGTSKWTFVNTTTTHYTVTGLTNNTAYEFVVLATNGSTWSKYTSENIVTCTPNSSTPYTPYLYITPGNRSIYVNWSASSYATKYRVFYRLNGTSKWTYKDTTSSEYTITGLTNGKKYDVLVLQYDGKTWSPWTNYDIEIATPVATTGKPSFGMELSGSNSIKVNWDPVPGSTKYRVFYRVHGASKWSFNELTPNNYSTYNSFKGCYYYINNLKANTTYDVLVLAYNGSKWSSWTNADVKTCKTSSSSISSPYIGKCLGENKKISLEWFEVSGATKYRVCYRLKDASEWSYKETTGTSFTLTGLTNGVTYEVGVAAGNSSGWSSFTGYYASPTASIWTPYIDAYTYDSMAVVGWSEVPNAVKYRVHYRVNGTSKWTTFETTDNWVPIEKLTNGKKYDFLVLASSNGTKWTQWDKSDILTSTLVAKVDLPTFSVYSSQNNPMVVQWNNVDNAVKYRVFYRLHGTTKWTFKDIAANANSYYNDYIIPGLTPGKNYDVIVLATDGSAWSKYTSDDIITATKYAE